MTLQREVIPGSTRAYALQVGLEYAQEVRDNLARQSWESIWRGRPRAIRELAEGLSQSPDQDMTLALLYLCLRETEVRTLVGSLPPTATCGLEWSRENFTNSLRAVLTVRIPDRVTERIVDRGESDSPMVRQCWTVDVPIGGIGRRLWRGVPAQVQYEYEDMHSLREVRSYRVNTGIGNATLGGVRVPARFFELWSEAYADRNRYNQEAFEYLADAICHRLSNTELTGARIDQAADVARMIQLLCAYRLWAVDTAHVEIDGDLYCRVYIYGANEPSNMPAQARPINYEVGGQPHRPILQYQMADDVRMFLDESTVPTQEPQTKPKLERRLTLSKKTQEVDSDVAHQHHQKHLDSVDQRLARRRRRTP